MARISNEQAAKLKAKMRRKPYLCVARNAEVQRYLGVGYDFALRMKTELEGELYKQFGEKGLEYLRHRYAYLTLKSRLNSLNRRHQGEHGKGIVDTIQDNIKLDDDARTDTDIAREFGVTSEYVRQITLKIKDKKAHYRKMKKLPAVPELAK